MYFSFSAFHYYIYSALRFFRILETNTVPPTFVPQAAFRKKKAYFYLHKKRIFIKVINLFEYIFFIDIRSQT